VEDLQDEGEEEEEEAEVQGVEVLVVVLAVAVVVVVMVGVVALVEKRVLHRRYWVSDSGIWLGWLVVLGGGATKILPSSTPTREFERERYLEYSRNVIIICRHRWV
jgi:hypothetical protein